MEFQRLLYQSVLWRSLYFLSQLVLQILIARHYEPSGSGWLFYTLNNYAFLILVLSLSMESGMGYFLASNRISGGKLVVLSMVWTAIAVIIASFFMSFFLRGGKSQFLVVSLCFMAGTLMIAFFSVLFYARKDFFTPNILLTVINVVLIALFLIATRQPTAWLTDENYLTVYISSFLIQGAALAIFFILFYSGVSSLAFPLRNEMGLLVKYSMLVFTGNVLTFLVFRVDYWLIDFFDRSADELGNYIQVSKLAQLFFTLPSALATAVFPFAAGGAKSMGGDLRILSRLIVCFATLACIIIALIGHWLFPAVFGEKFNKMYIPFLLMIPGIISICLAYPLAGYFSGNDMVRVNVISSVLALLLIIAGNIIFIPMFGINGASAVCSAGYVTLCVYLLINFRKAEPSSLSDLIIARKTDFNWLKGFVTKKSTP